MKRPSFLIYLTLAIIPSSLLLAQEDADESFVSKGPETGTLMIVGGAATTSVLKHFIQLAGGKDAPLVYIPTASGDIGGDDRESRGDIFRKLGATNVTVLHTIDHQIANTKSFVKPLLDAKGIWFGGGRQWRLVDAYKNTLVEEALWVALERGGLIGGSSAGASIQGSYLARGDTRNNQIMTGDHEVGFGFVSNIAIDQHHLARNRHFDMFDILKKHPKLLGIGIDEGTAIIVTGNTFDIMGDGYVAIYDRTFWSREGVKLKTIPEPESLFYFLRPGDRYDLENRKVISKR